MLQLVRSLCVPACFQLRTTFDKSDVEPRCLAAALGVLTSASSAANVVTQHGDAARTALTPRKHPDNGDVNQQLRQAVTRKRSMARFTHSRYVANVAISRKARTNVVFVATQNDALAFDADNNGGAKCLAAVEITLWTRPTGRVRGATAVPSTDSAPRTSTKIGITAHPHRTGTNTMYVVGKTKESGPTSRDCTRSTSYGMKNSSPVASPRACPGNGLGSSGGTLNFDPKWEHHAPACCC